MGNQQLAHYNFLVIYDDFCHKALRVVLGVSVAVMAHQVFDRCLPVFGIVLYRRKTWVILWVLGAANLEVKFFHVKSMVHASDFINPPFDALTHLALN